MSRGDSELLAAARARLAGATGAEYWRSLDELADTEEFRELVQREFPSVDPTQWTDPVSRRRFLGLMGASLALAGVTGCTGQPDERIVPYVRQPEEIVPGKPRYYATATTLGGYALGVLVESHMGRPTKVEGNPDHPASLGATDVFAQASVLTLYDPDRSKTVLRGGRISTWQSFLGELNARLTLQRDLGGSGLRILTGTVTSPTLARQLRGVLSDMPDARWHQYEPAGRDAVRRGAELAFGRAVDTLYRFDRADVVVSLDGDFLTGMPGSVRYARDFASRRRVRDGDADGVSRLYAVQSSPTVVGAMADETLRLRASRVPALARELARRLGAGSGAGAGTDVAAADPGRPGRAGAPDGLDAAATRFVAALAADLREHAGTSVVVPGEQQPAEVHASTHAINHALGNVGTTVDHVDPVEAEPVDQLASLRELVDDMRAGDVSLLLVLGGNPAYDAPADLGFGEALEKVGLRVHLGLYADETAELCHWHVPRAHELESWSDARAFDGTVSIVQPLIQPLYGGKSAHEVVAALAGEPEMSSHDLVRRAWQQAHGGDGFEADWRRALHDGLVAGTESAAVDVAPRSDLGGPGPASAAIGHDDPPSSDGAADAANVPEAGSRADAQGAGSSTEAPGEAAVAAALEVIFRPDPSIHDGRFANNGWLQELPKPLTKITWDNPVLLSPSTAERLGLDNEDEVELRLDGRTVTGAAWIVPGHADDAATVHLGYGRRRAGRVGDGAGFSAYDIRTTGAWWHDDGLEIRSTGGTVPLATTQHHHSMEGRHLVRHGTVEQFRAHPELVHEMGHEPGPEESLYPDMLDGEYQWGMSVDLSVCIGCNACVIGCQAENNIPVVGKQEVRRGREMHWIRIDRYWSGDLDDPDTWFQPVMCQHCENAPCEVVCPVAATTHSDEGLNEMTYNRCVGTRYCSNNCPYKVRRFNFLQYADYDSPVMELLNNPDVTVRTRGVMEKCTYCVQRINAARVEAKVEGRKIGDGDVVTACQQACPTQAISFGDISDPEAEVSHDKADPLSYGILAELGTRPRTTYMARITNPSPQLGGATPDGESGDGGHGAAGGGSSAGAEGHGG